MTLSPGGGTISGTLGGGTQNNNTDLTQPVVPQ
jgi:hypothetical protein